MRTIFLFAVCYFLCSSALALDNSRFKPVQRSPKAEIPSVSIGSMRLTQKQEHWVDAAARINLDIQYPYLDGSVSVKPLQRFNELVDDLIETEVGQYCALVDEIHGTGTENDLNTLANQGFSDIRISYKTVLQSKGARPVLSILFTIDSFISGSAHPNTRHRTLNYDVETGDGIALADLFKPQSDFIPLLNRYASKPLQVLTGKSEKQLLADNELNYSQWNITTKGLLVTFDELPHVYGLQQAFIPFDVMNPLLASNSVIQRARLQY